MIEASSLNFKKIIIHKYSYIIKQLNQIIETINLYIF